MRELFLAIFFASMGVFVRQAAASQFSCATLTLPRPGMHVYPTFLIENRWILFLLTIGTVVLKYTVSMLVCFTPPPPPLPTSASHPPTPLPLKLHLQVWVVGLRNTNFVTGHIIAVGLAQVRVGVQHLAVLSASHSLCTSTPIPTPSPKVSEFSFVLASRGKRMGVISRPMYYLLLSVTALTLLQAPLLWKLAFPVSSVAPRTTATK